MVPKSYPNYGTTSNTLPTSNKYLFKDLKYLIPYLVMRILSVIIRYRTVKSTKNEYIHI